MLTDDLTEAELNVFTVLERAASVASLLGCVVIIVTFSFSKSFHKPINRLVFYASLGNAMTNVATLMARTYVGDSGSAGCQLQGFLIQMFMPADAFWTLAMAVNVYLTFYRKYDAQKLRRMEIPYLLSCYGLPFIIAITYIFVQTPSKGRMYGNATIWCWIQQSWDVWRIATFYGPVWVAIVATFFIYIRAGREIYRKHQQLKDLNYTSHYEPEPLPMNEVANSKTTEVSVTVTSAGEAIDLAPLGINMNKHDSISGHSLGDPSPYSVSISAKPQPAAESSTAAAAANTSRVSTYGAQQGQGQGFQMPGLPKLPSRRKITLDAHNAAWSYTKVALLFFTAMLVTWIPSSLNRLFSLAEAGQINLPLEYMSAFVLPLQGFWNAVIYVITSWKACKSFPDDVASHWSGSSSSSSSLKIISGMNGRAHHGGGREREDSGDATGRGGSYGKSSKNASETESMEELAVRSQSISSC